MTKHLLTAFHCVVAAVVILPGLGWVAMTTDRHSAAYWLASVLVVVMPVLVISRVAWAAGYASALTDVAAESSRARQAELARRGESPPRSPAARG